MFRSNPKCDVSSYFFPLQGSGSACIELKHFKLRKIRLKKALIKAEDKRYWPLADFKRYSWSYTGCWSHEKKYNGLFKKKKQFGEDLEGEVILIETHRKKTGRLSLKRKQHGGKNCGKIGLKTIREYETYEGTKT